MKAQQTMQVSAPANPFSTAIAALATAQEHLDGMEAGATSRWRTWPLAMSLGTAHSHVNEGLRMLRQVAAPEEAFVEVDTGTAALALASAATGILTPLPVPLPAGARSTLQRYVAGALEASRVGEALLDAQRS